jgi:hypothetical protein
MWFAFPLEAVVALATGQWVSDTFDGTNVL